MTVDEAQVRAALPHLPFSGCTAEHVRRALEAAQWAAPADAPDPRADFDPTSGPASAAPDGWDVIGRITPAGDLIVPSNLAGYSHGGGAQYEGEEVATVVGQVDPDWSHYGAVSDIVRTEKVTRVTVNTWREKPGFPPPVTQIGGQDVYDLAAVRAWRGAATPVPAPTAVDVPTTSSPEAVPIGPAGEVLTVELPAVDVDPAQVDLPRTAGETVTVEPDDPDET